VLLVLTFQTVSPDSGDAVQHRAKLISTWNAQVKRKMGVSSTLLMTKEVTGAGEASSPAAEIKPISATWRKLGWRRTIKWKRKRTSFLSACVEAQKTKEKSMSVKYRNFAPFAVRRVGQVEAR
jgi:hypothetical protein